MSDLMELMIVGEESRGLKNLVDFVFNKFLNFLSIKLS